MLVDAEKERRQNTMKMNLPTIIAIAACVLLVFNSIKVIRLQEELERLRSSMSDEIHTVNQNISSIYGDVQEMLEKEANQLAVSEGEYGDIHIDSRSAEIICTVVPKVHTPEVTQAAIVCNGQEYALTYTDEQYTAAIELPLFDRNEFSMVKLSDNGTIRTQELDWIIEPRYEALLLSYAGMGGSASGKPGKGEYIWSTEYAVTINIERKGPFQVQSVELVEVLDGKEINRIPVNLSREGQEAYAEALQKTGEPVPEAASMSNEITDIGFNGSANFIYFLDKDYHIPNGSLLEWYVDVVDGNGLRYRSFAECVAVTKDGQLDELRMEERQIYAFAEAILIFDESGNVIYEIDPKLFQ